MPRDDSLDVASSDRALSTMAPAHRWMLGLALLGLLGFLAYLAIRVYLAPEMMVLLSNFLYLCH